VIHEPEAGFNDAFCYERTVRDWTIVKDLRSVFEQWRSDRFFDNGVKLAGNDEDLQWNKDRDIKS